MIQNPTWTVSEYTNIYTKFNIQFHFPSVPVNYPLIPGISQNLRLDTAEHLFYIWFYIIYFDNQNSLSFRGWKLSSQDTFYAIGCVMGSLFECLLILLIDLPLWSSTFLNMIKLLKHDFSEKKHWCKHVIISFMLVGNVTYFSPGEKNWTELGLLNPPPLNTLYIWVPLMLRSLR